MVILDAKGRLFGKISLLDLGALLIIGAVLVGIFIFPGTGGSVAQVGANMRPVEVDVIVRGLSVVNSEDFLKEFVGAGKTRIIIRNQPYGEVNIKGIEPLPRSVPVPQPDGTVIALPDPRPELRYATDMIVTLTGDAQITNNGVVFGNSPVKVGTQIQLEGPSYDFFSSTVGVRVLDGENE